MTTSQRPTALTIIAVLAIIGGIFYGVGGLLAVFASPFANSSAEGDAGAAGGIAIIGIVFVLLGFLNLIFGFGAMALKPWAWRYGIGLQIFNIITGLFSLPTSILGIVISGLVLYYLFRPSVKRVFGRA